MPVICGMKRHITQELHEWKQQGDRKPLILVGIRQCGKTYALQTFGKSAFPNVHYVNFEQDAKLAKLFVEDLDPVRIINELSYYLNRTIDLATDLMIFDEIQACPQALTSLKYFNELMPELALCSAGSLLGIQLNHSSFPVGKVNFLHMHPLTFSEFLLAIDESKLYELICHATQETQIPQIAHEKLWERMKWYWLVGGLPEVINVFCENNNNLLRAFNAAREKQNELILTYYADIAKYSGKVNAMHIDRVWCSVPAQLARTQDSSAKKFQVNIPAASHGALEEAQLDFL